MLLWDHQDVRRRYWPDVLEGDDLDIAEDFLGWNLASEDLAEKTLVGHRPSLPAEQTIGARCQRTNRGERPQGFAALRSAYRNVVVAEAPHLLRQAPVPDHLEVAVDEASLVGPSLGFRLDLQLVTAIPGDRVIHGKAEPRGRGPRPRRIAKDVHTG